MKHILYDTKELINLKNVEELSSVKPATTETGSELFSSFLISETWSQP